MPRRSPVTRALWPSIEIAVTITIEGHSARVTGERLGMSEGAVRVVLHRALKALAVRYRKEQP